MVESERLKVLGKGPRREGPVAYWMSRDQRVDDNWSLVAAQEMALARKAPLAVLFCLVPAYKGASRESFAFMLGGLIETARELARRRIPLVLLRGDPAVEIPRWAGEGAVSVLFCDFDPLREKKRWQEAVASKIGIPLFEIDGHNVVPCRFASPKQEYAAYTFRPKMKRLLPRFLKEIPSVERHPFRWPDEKEGERSLKVLAESLALLPAPQAALGPPGALAARSRLARFLDEGLARYDERRNDPNGEGQSGLSPYLHFGQISAQRVAFEVSRADVADEAKEAFLEELVVRRELADNFCLHNDAYDRFEGFPDWARKTLDDHRGDERPFLYDLPALEAARTGDPLWNAAQRQMVLRGRMQGWLRMYWAKKILEWSPSPEEALERAIGLNDRYELDGRDPNGYAGIAWSLGGVHDRAWPERPVFGKVRYMNLAGARRKFDVDVFCRSIPSFE